MHVLARLSLVSILTLCFSTGLYAEYSLWHPDTGVDLRQEKFYPEHGLSITGNGQGHALVVWLDRSRNAYLDIRAQLVDNQGVTYWQSEGILLSSADAHKLNPTVAYTGEDTWTIVWEQEGDAPWENDIHIQRITSDGTLQWQDGLVICNAEGYQYIPEIIPDGDGGAIIAWCDYRDYDHVEGNSFYGPSNVYLQRMNSAGESQWTDNGICAFENYSPYTFQNENRIKLMGDNAGGAIIGWCDLTSLLNWIDSSGESQWGGSVNRSGMRSFTFTPDNKCVVIRGQQGQPNSNMMDVINADGTYSLEDCEFGENRLCNQVFHAGDGEFDDDVIVSMNSSPPDWTTLVAQRYSIAPQSLVPEWEPDGGMSIFPDLHEDTFRPVFLQDPSGGFFHLRTSMYRINAGEPDTDFYEVLHLQKVGSEGGMWEDSAGVVIAEDLTNKLTLALSMMDQEHIGVAWLETGDKESKIKFQVVTREGEVCCDEPVILNHGVDFAAVTPQVVNSDGNLYVGWKDNRNRTYTVHGSRTIPYLQKLNPADGSPLWEANGIPLLDDDAYMTEMDHALFCKHYDLVADGNGGVLAGIINHDGDHQVTDLRVQKVDENGELLFGETGALLDETLPNWPSYMAMSPHSDGGGYILYQRGSNVDNSTKVLQRFSASGEPLWTTGGEPGVPFGNGTCYPVRSFLHTFDDNAVLAIIADFNPPRAETGYFAYLFDENGEMQWEEPEYLAESSDSTDPFIAVPTREDEVVFLFFACANNQWAAITSKRLTRDGLRYFADGYGIPDIALGEIEDPNPNLWKVAGCQSGTDFWMLGASANGMTIKKYDYSGITLVYEVDIPISDGFRQHSANPVLVDDGDGGVYCVWVDRDSTKYSAAQWVHVIAEHETEDSAYVSQPTLISSYVTQQPYHATSWDHPVLDAVPMADNSLLVAWSGFTPAFRWYDYESIYAQAYFDTIRTSSVNETDPSASEFTLESAYPNPFNPSTRIAFGLPHAARVTLTVVDILGREVETLINTKVNAGRHEVSWDASAGSFASGIYFFKLEAGGEVAIRKCFLIK